MMHQILIRGYSLLLERKKTTQAICAVLVIVMMQPVLTFARCSNCAANKCTTGGECLEGCVPGFVGFRCQEKCPPNCLNKTCHLDRQRATYVCSDGCQDGYCGSGCKLTCQNGCTTCDRASCSVCDVEPCVGNNYGEKCNPCSANFEKCDKDTGKCIKCKKGFYGESCEARCPTCLSRNQELQHGCHTGCDVCSEDQLQSGVHGRESYTACSSNCLSNRCDRSGRCTRGCKAGFYGKKCDVNCNIACTSMTCQQSNGRCVNGCINGYLQTDNGCEIFEGSRSQWIMPFAIGFLCLCILSVTIALLIIMRRLPNKSSRAYYKDMLQNQEDPSVISLSPDKKDNQNP